MWPYILDPGAPGAPAACRATVEQAGHASISALTANVSSLQDDIAGIGGNMSTAASTSMVDAAVSSAIAELDELGEVEF